jgi:general nucleoside transport system ATP-binding protein
VSGERRTVTVPALELRKISKTFGSVHALRGADFSLAPGEVHALLGENGAGKSTLMHIAYGMTGPDEGTIRVRGAEVSIRSPRDARALGIGMVHQHFTSIGGLTVGENIELAVGRLAGGREDGRTGTALPTRLMEGLPRNALVETLSVAQRQRLEIVKALATGATVLLLDEPSAVLAPAEVEDLLALVREFTAAGGSAVLITHKLPEVFLAADRVTVLRAGRVTLHAPVQGQTPVSLAEAMIGYAAKQLVAEVLGGQAPPVTRTSPASAPATARPAVRFGDIDIMPGELVGVAAVLGNGQRELLRSIAAGQGSSFVPEDRTTEGLIGSMSVTENIVLGLDRDPRWSHGWRLDWNAARRRAAELIDEFGIRAPGPDVPAANLSGGNQQKVVVARALEHGPRVLIAENPTRGLDVRASLEIHERLRAAAAQGVAVLVYSSDLDEVLELGQRVLVVYAGKVREAPSGADRRVVGEMMLGLGAVSGKR